MNVEERIKTSASISSESRTIIHFLLVHSKISEVLAGCLKPFDVSLEQFNVLRILRGMKGEPANLCTLNERMVTRMSNTTRLVDKLQRKGYVNRTICKANRRKVEILITEEGKAELTKMDNAIQMAEQDLLQNFDGNEIGQLNLLLNKF